MGADLCIRNVHLADDAKTMHTINIRGGRIAEIGDRFLPSCGEVLDAEGGLYVPPLVDPHIHLDAVLTVGQPQANQTGTLLEGIERWGQRKQSLTIDDVKQRAMEAIRWHVAHGVTKIRTHVDICDTNLTALKALIEIREEISQEVFLQIVAFPQDGVLCFPNGQELLEEAVVMGADVVGGIPHYEWTREDGVRELELVFDLARKYDRPIDVHCDETDDDQARFLETVANLTRKYQMGGQVTASHAVALGSYNNAYAFKLIQMLKSAKVAVIVNPLDNMVLQGRFDGYPRRRGLTRVKELIAAGVTVATGHDSIMDPWYPLGTGNQILVGWMLAHAAHMTGSEELRAVWETMSGSAAKVMQLKGYGVGIGDYADGAIFNVAGLGDVLRLAPMPQWVLSSGIIVAHTPSRRTSVQIGGITEEVSLIPHSGDMKDNVQKISLDAN